MIEFLFHGRGGQGAVTAAELLAVAAGEAGKYSQAFPFFGVERRGAPVQSFCRISDEPIIIHEHVYAPDAVIVLDSTLISTVNVFDGLKKNSVVVVNSAKPPVNNGVSTFFVDASKFAVEKIKAPIVSTAMLGALVKATSVVSLESFETALAERFGKNAQVNFDLLKICYEQTVKL